MIFAFSDYEPEYRGGWFEGEDHGEKTDNGYKYNMQPTHTPQQVLEMAGMVETRKVRKDFDPSKKYNVDVSGCTDEEKKAVQQAFFDIGFPWPDVGNVYQYLAFARYTNAMDDGHVTGYCMYGSTAASCNMTSKEFLSLVYEPEQQGHIHAENMALFAEDAKTHLEPWKLWECRANNGTWCDCLSNPRWVATKEYRRKPKTHIVNGVEIPDLRFKPEIGQQYWCPAPSGEVLVFKAMRRSYAPSDNHRVANNLCYEDSEEGKKAAILHTKAWLGIEI